MSTMKSFKLRPRYYRLYTDPGIVEAEENYRYRELDWEIPLADAALVCLDVWNWHYSKDTLDRTEHITREKIAPLVAVCRAAGLQVIHAPASPVAERHPNWVGLVPEGDGPKPVWLNSPDWPPKEFEETKGRFAQYARPEEPQKKPRKEHSQKLRDFHPVIRPQGDEAVILTGEELHRLCAQRGVLHLFYVGFNTNMCMIQRDYGTYEMMLRGYGVVLVRDCTTGMETHETKAQLMCTKGVIATLEQCGVYTVTSEALRKALVQDD